MNPIGSLLILVGILQVTVNSTWFCHSMLWSVGGFFAGIGVGYVIRIAQERLGGTRNDHT